MNTNIGNLQAIYIIGIKFPVLLTNSLQLIPCFYQREIELSQVGQET